MAVRVAIERLPKVRGVRAGPIAPGMGRMLAGLEKVAQPTGGQPKITLIDVVTPFCRLSQAAP